MKTRLPTFHFGQTSVVRWLLAASLLLLPTALTAQGFSVGPVRIAMTADKPSASVEVRSGDFASSLLVQATAFVWTEADGERELVPTEELLLNPAVFKLDPGGVRTIILSAEADGLVPRYYRIRVEEVADEADEARTAQLRMLRAFDLPVFIEASGAEATVTAEAEFDVLSGEAHVQLRNEGNAHAVGTAVRLLAGESTITETSGLYYLLPGVSREIVLTLPEQGSRPLLDGASTPALRFEVDDGSGEVLVSGAVTYFAGDDGSEGPSDPEGSFDPDLH